MDTPLIILVILFFLSVMYSGVLYLFFHRRSGKLVKSINEKEAELSHARLRIEEFEREIEDQVNTRMHALKQEFDEERERDQVLKRALKKAEDANFLLNSFLSNVSSEIRTPLNNIIGFAGLLEADLSMMENKELFDFAHAVSESGDRLLHLLNNIIDISRVESNDFTLKPMPLPVNAIIARTIQVYLFQANERKLKLNFKPSDIPEGYADEGGLSKVLSIILENSIKFTENGFINVSTEHLREKNQVSVRIKDTGTGIDPAFLPEILSPFKNETTGFSNGRKGSGLGLPLAKSLMEMMQGKLEIQSEKGTGTTVTLFLRTAVVSLVEPLEASPDLKKQARTLHDLNIFIVEDDIMNRLVLTEMTKSLGNVVSASNGDETLKILTSRIAENFIFDIMLFDINLPPPWDGVRLMKEIRKTWKPYRSVPFIAQTAYALAGDRQKLLEAGFDDYISKPINQQQLFSIMKNQLNKY
jgi:signal transduction histidine kinase/CheY-like chemotaxis protein